MVYSYWTQFFVMFESTREISIWKDVKDWGITQRVNAFSKSESNFSETGGVGELLQGGRWRIEQNKNETP